MAQYKICTKRLHNADLLDYLWAADKGAHAASGAAFDATERSFAWELPPFRRAMQAATKPLDRTQNQGVGAEGVSEAVETFGGMIKDIFHRIINVTGKILGVRRRP